MPQLKKAWTTGQTDDISMNMLLVLASGLALWIVYGALKEDVVIILANGISLTLIGGLLYLKMMQARLCRRSCRVRTKTKTPRTFHDPVASTSTRHSDFAPNIAFRWVPTEADARPGSHLRVSDHALP